MWNFIGCSVITVLYSTVGVLYSTCNIASIILSFSFVCNGLFSGVEGHGPSTIPVTIPAPSAVSPQVSRSIVAQTSSSCSSDAEVAELAGGSIEDSMEMKRRFVEQQTEAAGREAGQREVKNPDHRPSTQSNDEGGLCLYWY